MLPANRKKKGNWAKKIVKVERTHESHTTNNR